MNIPKSIQAKGIEKCVQFVLSATAIGKLHEVPELRMAMSQELFLDNLRPFVYTPIFIEAEEALVEQWKTERPKRYEFAAEAAERLEVTFGDCEHYDERKLLRIAAYRKLDVSVNGSEVFDVSPALGTDPYVPMPLAGAEDFSVNIGPVLKANYNPTPKGEDRLDELLKIDTAPAQIEKGIFALLPDIDPSQMAEYWDHCVDAYVQAAPIREYEASSKLPAFPELICIDPADVPEGLEARFSTDFLKTHGLDTETLAQAGITPYMPGPLVAYLEAQGEYVQQLAEDESLPTRYWTRLLRPGLRASAAQLQATTAEAPAAAEDAQAAAA